MVLSRVAGVETLGIYMMILPIIGLLISISQAGVPSALFTLTSSPHTNHRKIFLSSALLCLVQMILCLILVLIFSQYFITIQPYLFIIMLFIIIASLSALLRSYHLGHQQAHIPAISNIIEEIVRMSIIGICFLKTSTITLKHVFMAMLLGESSSCFYMLIKIKAIKKLPSLESMKDLLMYKEILSISIPVSGTQLVHSFCHSLEPMIYQYFLLQSGWTKQEINQSYGILNGCVLSLLMIPTFLNTVIYRILLPKITQSIDNKKRTQELVIKSMILCVLMGLPFSILFYCFPSFSLQLLFETTEGSAYLSYLAIPFLIYYLQTPLQAYLQASRCQNLLFSHSLIQTVVSLILLAILLPIVGPVTLAISFLCGLIINTILCFISVYRRLFLNNI